MTCIVNLLGGSGIGKSTTAAGLYYKMKLKGYHVELVREYVKNWMWEERRIGDYDQIYIAANQAKSEYDLYGKVDFIITDSPMILAPVYEEYYSPPGTIRDSVVKFMKKAEDNGVQHLNVLLKRNKLFDTRGRRETLEQAQEVDLLVQRVLDEENIPYITMDCPDRQRVNKILKYIENKYNLPGGKKWLGLFSRD